MGMLTDNDRTLQIGSGSQNYRPAKVIFIIFRANPLDLAILHNQLINQKLLHIQTLLIFADLLHAELVVLLVRLCPESMDSRPLPRVQHPELDAGLIGINAHLPPQGIQLPDQMSLARTSYRRIAGHHGNIIHTEGSKKRLTAQPCRCQCRLHPCMAGTDDNYIILTSHKYIILIHALTSKNLSKKQNNQVCHI